MTTHDLGEAQAPRGRDRADASRPRGRNAAPPTLLRQSENGRSPPLRRRRIAGLTTTERKAKMKTHLHRRSFVAALTAAALSLAAPALAQDKSIVVVVDHIDAGFRPVRPHPAAVQGQDRHRREGDLAGHRPGARHRPPRRRRRGVRARQAAGGEIRRRRLRREALSGDVQRLRPGRAEERSGRREGPQTSSRRSRRSRPRPRRSSRAATAPARMPPSSLSGRPRTSTSRARTRAPGTRRSGRAWARRSTPRRRRTPMCSPTAAPGCRSRTAATSTSSSRATTSCSTSTA